MVCLIKRGITPSCSPPPRACGLDIPGEGVGVMQHAVGTCCMTHVASSPGSSQPCDDVILGLARRQRVKTSDDLGRILRARVSSGSDAISEGSSTSKSRDEPKGLFQARGAVDGCPRRAFWCAASPKCCATSCRTEMVEGTRISEET